MVLTLDSGLNLHLELDLVLDLYQYPEPGSFLNVVLHIVTNLDLSLDLVLNIHSSLCGSRSGSEFGSNSVLVPNLVADVGLVSIQSSPGDRSGP